MLKLFLIICLLFSSTLTVSATGETQADLTPNAKSAVLIEPVSGKIIYEKNAHKRLYPASMTKMMGMILVLEAIDKGRLSWDQMVTVSVNAEDMGGSQVYLAAGEKMSVTDLFKSIAIASANDAMVCLAEEVAATEENFVLKMNEKAKEFGLSDTNFVNCTGLHDEKHYSSAYDMAVIAMHLLDSKHDAVLRFSSVYEDYIRTDTEKPFWLVNTNKVIRNYEGADGLKTGYTSQSLYCITLTAKRNGLRLISVLMGSPTRDLRNAEASKLLTYGFNSYEQKLLYPQGSSIMTLRIENGKPESVELLTKEDVPLIYSKGSLDYTYEEEVIVQIDKAPIKAGQTIAQLIIKTNEGLTIKSDLVAQSDIEPLRFLDILYKSMLRILS